MQDSAQDDYYAQARSEMLQFLPARPRRVLDVGCGLGSFGGSLKKRFGSEVWGVEYDPSVAERAEQQLDKVYSGDILPLIEQLPDGHFDAIVFNDVLEHLVDPFQVLIKIKRCLTADGKVICSIPNIRYFDALRTIVVYKDFKYEDSGIFDRTHLRFFTRKSMIRMFDELNYDLIRIEGINPKRHWVFKFLNLLLFNSLADARYAQYACVAKVRNAASN